MKRKLSIFCYNFWLFLAITIGVFISANCYADDAPQPFPEPQKKWMIDHGVGAELDDTFDLFGNMTGGKRQGIRPLNTIALSGQIDGNKAFNLPGVTVTLSVIESSFGTPSRSLVGSVQRIDNMEPANRGFDVYLAWVQKNWLNDRISLLAGVYDLSDEFYTTNSSDFFINTAFGFGPEISEIGKHNHPAVFPTSAPSVRLKFIPLPDWYIETALSDGINSDPNNHPTSIPRLDSTASAIVMGETGYMKDVQDTGLDKLAFGGWRYISEIRNFLHSTNATTPVDSGVAQGAYVLGEYKLYSFSPDRSLVSFARIDLTDTKVNEYSGSWSAGITWNHVIPEREHSQLGLAFSEAINDSNYKKTQASLGLNADFGEIVTELSYKDSLLPWLTIQPDAQYISNPGALGLHKDAIVAGARLEAKF